MKNEKEIRWTKPTPKGYDIDYTTARRMSKKEISQLLEGARVKPKAAAKNKGKG